MNTEDKTLYQVFLQLIRLHYYRSHILFEKDGIYHGQPPLLRKLYFDDGQSQKELAEKLKISTATLNVMIKRMEKSGFLERRQDKDDHRISRVFLTELGKDAYFRVEQTTKIIENECFANFTLEEQVLLRRLMLQMHDNLKDKIDN